MKIVVLVKYVPEPTATWSFGPDHTLNRSAVEGRLSELDEYAVEQAVRLVEGGLDAEIAYLCVGPAKATDALLKALAIGGHSAVHVLDDGIAGSDALATSLVIAKALEKIGYDLIIGGMASTDAEMSVVPAMVAERLGIGQATFAGELHVEGGQVTIRRSADLALEQVSISTPAVVTVTDQTGEARYPAFRAIMGAKKKPVTKYSLADLGVDPSLVGLAAAATKTVDLTHAPPRAAGEVITDSGGDSAPQIAQFLTSRGFF